MTTKVTRNMLDTSIDDNGNATAITIDSSEQIGIGTATPNDYDNNAAGISSNLVVKDSGHSGIIVISGASSDAAISFGDGTGTAAYRGAVAYVNSADALYFKAGGNNKLRLDSDGLKFNSDTAAANALDDYEQGTWTPTLPNGGTINTNYSSRYTKIGNVVYWHSYLLLSFVNDSNDFRITLPFNTSSVTSNTYVHGTVGYTGSVVTDDLRSHVQKGVNPAYLYFHETDGASGIVANSNLYARNYSDGRLTALLLSGWYYTED